MTNLGSMLRLHRVSRNLTLREMAPTIGISHATLSRIESGRAMDAVTLLLVLNWLLREEAARG